jgi:hypothetical protein
MSKFEQTTLVGGSSFQPKSASQVKEISMSTAFDFWMYVDETMGSVRLPDDKTDRHALSTIVDWCKDERQRLQRQLTMLQFGKFRIGENRGIGWVDTSSESIDRFSAAISELDRLLAN